MVALAYNFIFEGSQLQQSNLFANYAIQNGWIKTKQNKTKI